MQPKSPRDLGPSPTHLNRPVQSGSRSAIELAVVYPAASPAEANARLGGLEPGYVYQRDSHPNADDLAERCRELHRAERAAITSCGMSALALAQLALLRSGDHVVVSSLMYGKTIALLTSEAERLGIRSTVVDTNDLAATAAAVVPETRLLVCETISNPLMRVADVPALAKLAKERSFALLVDNTFASPVVCRPLEWGADLVMESMTKIMNGHSDAMLGLLCGREIYWERVHKALTTWGLAAAPFDCWLVERGLGTLYLRVVAASRTAERLAAALRTSPAIAAVHYPGLPDHPDQQLASQLFVAEGGRPLFGHMLSFELKGGLPAAERLISGLKQIHFCPSLGELATTLSHPTSTSHRGMTPQAREGLGIRDGLIRLSVGLESPEFIENELFGVLRTLDAT
jgi:cystathionine beta-lyase/cystathionine gamma-synthase